MNKQTKKAVRLSLIIFFSVLLLLIVLVGGVSAFILSNYGIEKSAKYAIEKYSPCRVETGSISLTLLKTFPHLSLELKDVVVYNDLDSAPTDTLASIDRLFAGLDLKPLLKNHLVIIESITLENSQINLFSDKEGKSVLDIFSDSLSTEEKDSEPFDISSLDSIDINFSFRIDEIGLSGANISYIDQKSRIEADVVDIHSDIYGRIDSLLKGDLTIKLRSKQVNASLMDSIKTSAVLTDLDIKALCNIVGDDYKIDGNVGSKKIAVSLGSNKAGINDVVLKIASTANLSDKNVSANAKLSSKDLSAAFDSLKFSTSSAGFDMTVHSDLDLKKVNLSAESVFDAVQMLMNQDNENISSSFGKIQLNCEADVKPSLLDGNGKLTVSADDMSFAMNGGDMPISVSSKNIGIDLPLSKVGKKINLSPTLFTPSLLARIDGETYVNNWPIQINVPLTADTTFSAFAVDNATASINDQRFGIDADCKFSSLDDIDFNASLNLINIDLKTILSMIPNSFQSMIEDISAKGKVNAKIIVDAAKNKDIINVNYADAYLSADNFSGSYKDSMSAETSHIDISIAYPGEMSTAANQTADLFVKSGDLKAKMIGDAPIDAKLEDIDISGYVSGFLNGIDNTESVVFVNSKQVNVSMDTISANIGNLGLSAFAGLMNGKNGKAILYSNFKCDTLEADMGSMISANIGKTDLFGEIQIDTTKEDYLLRYSPMLTVLMNNAHIDYSELLPISIPNMDLKFDLDKCQINNSNILFGNSDINLDGKVENLGAWLNNTGLMTGDLNFVSNHTDMTQLMSLISAPTVDSVSTNTSVAEIKIADTIISDTIPANPFIVPLGVDITLNTDIKEMEFNDHLFNNLGGDISIKDGTLILQELGFSSNAAEMQLTALYKSPKTDELFVSFDFHLLDIEIAELIDLIPSVDSIVPMLKDFDGKAQFHLTAETRLDQYYSPIMRSLIGAAAIEGQDLVVMDNDVFNGIKRKLLMSKRAENKIDSLSIEMQVLRNKVDLYPFLIHMDRYSAVIGGRHNINKGLSCRYHISLTESPLPFRLGVTISGPINDISEKPLKHIKLSRCEYKKYFVPQKEGITEQRTLQMKQDILNTLRSNVRE